MWRPPVYSKILTVRGSLALRLPTVNDCPGEVFCASTPWPGDCWSAIADAKVGADRLRIMIIANVTEMRVLRSLILISVLSVNVLLMLRYV